MCYDISRGLLCDCENLREPSNSIRFKLGSTLLVTNCRVWCEAPGPDVKCSKSSAGQMSSPWHAATCRGGGGTQQLVMIHTCCEVSIRRAAIQCLRITHSPSHNHQAVRYKWFDLEIETLSYTECKKWLDIRRRRDSPRYANMISNMQYRLPKIFFKYSHWHSNIQTCSWDQSTARNTTGDIQLALNDSCNDATHTNYKCDQLS